jgi:hypothetical protein
MPDPQDNPVIQAKTHHQVNLDQRDLQDRQDLPDRYFLRPSDLWD